LVTTGAVLLFLLAVDLLVTDFLGFGNRIFRIAGDPLDWKVHQLIGWNFVDCGHAVASPETCVLTAFQEHRPFRVRYDVETIDEWEA